MENRPLGEAEELALLRRYRPLLAYDPQEEHRALAIESAVDNAGNTLVRNGDLLIRKGEVLASADGEGNHVLTLDLLAQMKASMEADEDDHIALVSTATAIRRTQDAGRYPAVVYGRAVEDGDRLWLQYWLWFYFRLGNLFGWKQHQGGWELVQVGLDRDRAPEVLTANRDQADVAADWSQVGKWQCEDPCAGPCQHLVARIDLFTHAIAFEPATGTGVPGPAMMPERCLPEVRQLGAWSEWPGRWGATASQWGFGKSPRGPAHQSRGWESPAELHREADDWTQQKNGRRPATPEVREMRIDGDKVTIEVATPTKRLLRPRWLFATVHESQGLRVIRKRIVRAGKDGITSIRIPLLDCPDDSNAISVCVSSFNLWRRRSDVAESGLRIRLLPAAEDERLETWTRRIRRRFHHGLLKHLDEHGALTTAQLRKMSPRILDLPLTDPEVDELIESARRHRLVEPLSAAANGNGNTEPEWTPTERGREKIGGPMQMGSGLLKFVPLALIIPVAIEQSKNLKDTGDWFVAILVVIATLFLVLVGIFFIHHWLQGALPRTLAGFWDRHAVELPALNRWYRRRARNAPYLLGAVLVIALGVGATLSEISGTGRAVLELGGLVLLYATAFLVGADLIRIAVLRNEAKALRRDEQARNPDPVLPPAPNSRSELEATAPRSR